MLTNPNSALAEAMENVEAAVKSTRGMYPITTASNIFKADGTTLEPAAEDATPTEDPPAQPSET